jgi:hypothetical protein
MQDYLMDGHTPHFQVQMNTGTFQYILTIGNGHSFQEAGYKEVTITEKVLSTHIQQRQAPVTYYGNARSVGEASLEEIGAVSATTTKECA